MHYINADGTLAQMCGNGVRCFAKYLVDRELADVASGSLVADTLAGPRPIAFSVDAEGKMTEATVNMGAPILDPVLVPVDAAPDSRATDGAPYVGHLRLDSPWGTFEFVCVSMGNPHAVCLVDDWAALPTSCSPLVLRNPSRPCASIFPAPSSRRIPYFPRKPTSSSPLSPMRASPCACGRGAAARPLACGTGACATNTAACLTGRAGRENDLLLSGGLLHICWNEDDTISMTGPATESFSGTIVLP